MAGINACFGLIFSMITVMICSHIQGTPNFMISCVYNPLDGLYYFENVVAFI